MNLEYEISLDYDLDLSQTYWRHFLNKGKIIFIPARYFSITLGLSSIGLIIWGIIETNPDDATELIITGTLCFLCSIFLFFLYRPQNIIIEKLSSSNRNSLQKQWSEYYEQKYKVNLILTPEEFILKSDDLEKAYSWKAFKSLDEYSAGFIIAFFDGYEKFIPKLAFNDEDRLNTFKQYISSRANLIG